MKKLITKFLPLLFICTILITNITSINTHAVPLLEAQGVVLMDGKSGEILYSQNADVQYEPASITKVMTAIVVLENTKLDDKVTIGTNPPLVDGSAIGIREGEVYTVEELLIAMLLESANDCAEALAEFVSGSNADFGKLMTERAKELGCTNSIFKNPSGLHEEGHLTTANDMSKIMRFALNFDDFNRISRIISYQYVNHPYSDGTEKWATNRNNCYVDWSQWYYENIYCGKTGWTPEANHTYVAAAIKDEEVLVASFLNAYNKDTQYSSVGQLFDWGFENFDSVKLFSKGDVVGEYQISDNTSIPLLTNKDIYYTLSAGQDPNITTAFNYADKDYSESSIKKGDVLFNATLIVNGEKHTTLELVSGIDREYTTKIKIENTFNKFASNKIIIVLLVLLILSLAIYLYIRKRKINKKRDFMRKKYNLDI
ncbi:D-alanyl-D-alanine carboxypeptidase dacB precursor [uncultured Clostridium sp.]|uniref:D-alanyl-D-alanine carboxypeptidase family protein n=1 Tax=uncultured Clostridium sp. TaxID=59620 RepID=UPI000822E830|nr:D-alanyl-D-alanine carboxypeptidase family protein [uncultured Clostridium sp.]SCJ90098.1 D-alanyl-D-alanine carboxypeptidase dacB precursor [uncultured Clostridium sp.]